MTAAVDEPQLTPKSGARAAALEGIHRSVAALRAAFDALAEAAATRDVSALDQDIRKLVADAERRVQHCVEHLRNSCGTLATKGQSVREQAQQMLKEVIAAVEAGTARVRAAAAQRVADTPALARVSDQVHGARSRVVAATDSAVATAHQYVGSATAAATGSCGRIVSTCEQLTYWAEGTARRARTAALEAAAPATAWAGEACDALHEASKGIRSRAEPSIAAAQCRLEELHSHVDERSPETLVCLRLAWKTFCSDLPSAGISSLALFYALRVVLLIMQAVIFYAHPPSVEWALWGCSQPSTPNTMGHHGGSTCEFLDELEDHLDEGFATPATAVDPDE